MAGGNPKEQPKEQGWHSLAGGQALAVTHTALPLPQGHYRAGTGRSCLEEGDPESMGGSSDKLQ